MEWINKNKSLIILILLSCWIIVFRASHIERNEISWDVFGYYLPLQATFIEGDMLLNERGWVEELNNEHKLSGTLYQLSTTPEGEPMYFFFFGMSYLYSVFFFIGHFLADYLGYPQNGLSLPYQYSLALGCMIYTIIGLYYLRKLLRHFLSDGLAALLLFVCVIGTNYSHHMTLKNLETVNILFMFVTIVMWNTIKWHEAHRLKNMLAVGISIVLMTLIKPSEILIILFPLLWGIKSFRNLPERLKLLAAYRKQLLIVLLACFVIALPQIVYWYVKTGHLFYDSYMNPGIGLDIFSPHLFDSLFSYRKGWLLYTPVMLFALIGFYFVYKRQRQLFIGLFVPFLISFYIIASWTEFWYGAGFSNRPVIAQYPILLIAMGYFFQWLSDQKKQIQLPVYILMAFFIFLNQFQWWQLRNYILDPTRTTKAYYWSTFLKTSVTEDQKKMLLIERSYDGIQTMTNLEDYSPKVVVSQAELTGKDESGNNLEFMNTIQIPYQQLTDKDHCWVEYSFEYKLPDSVSNDVYFATMMNRKNGDYGNRYYNLITDSRDWVKYDTLFLTPEIRSKKDLLKFFFWNPNFVSLEVKNLNVKVFEPKQ